MAKDKLTEYDATAANNTVVGDVNLAENSCLPSDLNNAVREVMSHQKEAFGSGTPLYVDQTNNRVGIGEASPAAPLHISTGASTTAELRLTSNNTGSGSGDRGRIAVHSSRNDGTAYEAGRIDIDRSSGTEDKAHILFGTNNGSGVAERMRIDSSGNVGIGTSSPVSNSGYGGLTLNGDNGSIFSLKDSDTEVARVVGSATEMSFQYGTSSVLTFKDGLSGGAERMRIDNNGNVYIGGTGAVIDGGSKLGVHGRIDASATSTTPMGLNRSGSDGVIIDFGNDGTFGIGHVSVSGSSVAYATSSDHRLKEAVVDMTGAIARVKQLAPKRFNFIADTTDTLVDGFLAHEAQTVVPEAVTGTHNEVDADGNAVMQGIDQSKLVPLLTAALKESIAKIETLETKVAALEAGS